MRSLAIVGLVYCISICICILPVTLAWNPPAGYVPERFRGHSPLIHTKPTWPPHVPYRPPHCNTTARNNSQLTSAPIVTSWLLKRAQQKKLETTIQEQTKLIIQLQQKLTAYELKEELREFWITELQDVRWAGWAQNELLVVSRVNVSNLRPKL